MNTINTNDLINFLLQQQNTIKSIVIKTAYKIFIDKLNLYNRPGTLSAYKTCLKPILKYLYDHDIFNTSQITNDVINKFIKTRLPFVKNKTINKEICGLKTMLNICIQKKYIDKLPFEFKKLKEDKPNIEKIKSSDLKKILKYFDNSKVKDKYKLAFLLILTTGIRTNELLNIKNANISLSTNKILLDFTKTHKNKYIYIVDSIKPLLISTMNSNKYLFNDDNNIQMSANALRCFFKHLKKYLNIDVLSPHKLRHYYATDIYKKSLDIYLVSQLLGHNDIKTTQIYLDIDNKENQIKNNFYNPINDLLTG